MRIVRQTTTYTIRALLFLTGLLLGACASGRGPTHPVASPTLFDVPVALDQVVALVRPEAKNPHCAGVWVGPEAFVTSAHCLDAFDTLSKDVLYAAHSEYDAEAATARHGRLILTSDALDLAFVRTHGAPSHHYAVACPSISVGSRVHAVGHPLGLWWTFTSGEVSALRAYKDGKYVQTTAPTSPGNSGGALFDDETGCLAGIGRSIIPAGANLAFYVAPEVVSYFVYRGFAYDE